MLSLVKWAYNLGVRNERHRIAQFLSSAQASRVNSIRSFEEEFNSRPIESRADARNRKYEERQRRAAVDQEVIDIISNVFYAPDEYRRGASVMFPEGEEK